MTNLFKKTLVAAAVMATTATTAYAATLTVGAGSVISKEGARSETAIALPSVTITLGDEYAVNDRLVIRVTGAEVASQVSATLTNSSGVIQLGKLASTSDNEAVFRITSIGLDSFGDTLPTTGEELVLSGLTLSTASVIDGSDVNVTYQGRLSDGTVIETSASAKAIEVETQFAVDSIDTVLDGVIDVNKDRQEFVDGTTDSFSLSFSEETGLSLAATATTVTHTLFGDFSYVDTDGDGDADVTFTATSTGDDTFSLAFDDMFMSATITQSVNGEIDAPTVTVAAPGQAMGNPTLEKQDFTATVSIAFLDNQGETGNSTLANVANVGEWTLNGAQVYVPYLPVGFANVINRVILANDGSQNGEIEVEAFDGEGNSYGPVSLGLTLAAGSNLSITGAQVAEALGITGEARLSTTFTINAPASDVTATGFTQRTGAGRQLLTVE